MFRSPGVYIVHFNHSPPLSEESFFSPQLKTAPVGAEPRAAVLGGGYRLCPPLHRRGLKLWGKKMIPRRGGAGMIEMNNIYPCFQGSHSHMQSDLLVMKPCNGRG